ncbi:MAG: exo-alpha-sialidase [Parachlamydiales bacterium]|nr:exo-alpha-sialidase [Parachlamydiales bacterium]
MKNLFLTCLLWWGTYVYAQLDWSPPINLSDPGYSCDSQQVAMNDLGHAITIWRQKDGSYYNIFVSYTADYGATWSSPQLISQTGKNNLTPQVILNDLGHAIATWSSNNTIHVVSSADYGASWSSIQTLSAGYAIDPEVDLDASGNAILIWREISGSVRIKVSHSADAGVTWSSGMFISSAASYSPKIVLDAFGHAIAVWQQQGTTSYIIVASYSLDYGASWSIASDISEVTVSSEFPQITLDNSGNAVAVWRQQSNNSVQISYSSDYGVNWSAVQTLSIIGNVVQDPQISMNTSGNVVSIWRELLSGTTYGIKAVYSSDYGASWSSPVTISDPTHSAIRPKIGINDSMAIATFQQALGAFQGIFATDSSDFGITWSSLDTLSEMGYYSLMPDMAITRSSIVVWARSDGTNAIIQASYEHPLPPSPTIYGSTSKEVFPLRIDLQNVIICDPIEDSGTYKLYADSSLTILLQSIFATNTRVYFYDHLQKKGESKTYYVTWTSEGGDVSEPSSVTIVR